MLAFKYHKANPTDYVLHFSRGRLAREGAGLSFFYFGPASSIVSVPLASSNVPFVFHEPTADFQVLTVQGQMTFRIAEPKKAAAMLNLTLDAKGQRKTDDDQKLPERLIYGLQTLLRTEIQRLPLRDALFQGDQLTATVMTQLKTNAEVVQLGIEILSLAILSLKPTPEMSKALEAETRERLNKTADEAVYARRNAAIEQERMIKENELQTEMVVQTKQRELQERELEGAIALEKQRSALTEQKAENERKEADTRAYALKAVMEPIQGMDWRLLMTLQSEGGNPANTIAMAFQELAANAQKIGELNMSPDLLRSLVGSTRLTCSRRSCWSHARHVSRN
jgi:regulator of protease activity HflC (stomatin/prohibitin superfamily)